MGDLVRMLDRIPRMRIVEKEERLLEMKTTRGRALWNRQRSVADRLGSDRGGLGSDRGQLGSDRGGLRSDRGEFPDPVLSECLTAGSDQASDTTHRYEQAYRATNTELPISDDGDVPAVEGEP